MEVGEKIDNYIVTEVLSGGMSEVYRVSDGTTRYVLKRVREDATEEQIKLFKREIRILKSLSHPNIIDVLNVNDNVPFPYYVMPNCGKSFVDLSVSDATERERTEVAITFCKAILFAHEKGVFHRDIKPNNILFDKGVLKVADFGLSRFENRDTTTITQDGMVAGTRGYMPPEYYNGGFKDGSIASDIYMIGKTLYYLFSHGGDVSNVRLENVSPQIYHIINKATKDRPEDRYASLEPIIDSLQKYLDALIAAEEAPKTIQEIRTLYQSLPLKFDEEVYKTLRACNHESESWASTIRQLNDTELERLLNHKRDYIGDLSTHFIDCLSKPSDYIQFCDIDEFARFTKLLVNCTNELVIKQNLIAFLLKMSIDYNRYPAMQEVANILNSMDVDMIKKCKAFIVLHRFQLQEICKQLNNNDIYNSRISTLICE